MPKTSRTLVAALGLLLGVATDAGASGPSAAAAPSVSRAPRPAAVATVRAKAPTAAHGRAAPPAHVAPVRPATAQPPPGSLAGPGLWTDRERGLSTGEATDHGARPVPSGLLPHHAPGAFLGKGGFKKVYVAKGDPSAVLRVMQPEEDGKVNVFGEWIDAGAFLGNEHRLLGILERHGFPVVRVLAKGEYHGIPADVLERYDFSDRDKDHFAREGRAVLRTAVPDLLRIRRALESSGLAILDLQVLMKRGHVVIADPMDVVARAENPRAYAENLRFVDDLLAQAGAGGTN